MYGEYVLTPEDLLCLFVDCLASLHQVKGVRDCSSGLPLHILRSHIVTLLYRDLVDYAVDDDNMIIDGQPHLSRQTEKCDL